MKRALIVKEYRYLAETNIEFIREYFEGIIPAGRPEEDIYWKTKSVAEQLKVLLTGRACRRRDTEIDRLLADYLQYAKAYFYQGEPWNTITSDRRACRNTILSSVQMIANLTVWLAILGEHSAQRILQELQLDTDWTVHSVHSGVELRDAEEVKAVI